MYGKNGKSVKMLWFIAYDFFLDSSCDFANGWVDYLVLIKLNFEEIFKRLEFDYRIIELLLSLINFSVYLKPCFMKALIMIEGFIYWE